MDDNELYAALMNKASLLCARREMCLSDMKRKLIDWGASDKQSEIILKQLSRDRFIDEKRYAVAFTRDKFMNNRWGRIKIAHALKLKNIPGSLIDESMATIDEDSYLEMMRVLISQHRNKIKSKNQYDLKGKLLRYGLSKGFESYLLYDLLNDIL